MLRGECAKCGTIFNVLGNCPVCSKQEYTAYGPEGSPVPHVLNNDATACRWDCDACRWVRDQKPDIAELERMFRLEDSRG